MNRRYFIQIVTDGNMVIEKWSDAIRLIPKIYYRDVTFVPYSDGCLKHFCHKQQVYGKDQHPQGDHLQHRQGLFGFNSKISYLRLVKKHR